MEAATGWRPAPVRVGGTLPVIAVLAAKGVPTILTGFGLPDDAIHAPDESLRVEHLELGTLAAWRSCGRWDGWDRERGAGAGGARAARGAQHGPCRHGDAGRRPQVSPVWIALEGDRLAIYCGAASVKASNLRRDGRVAISIADEVNPTKRR